jgi:hypothetical protein
LKRKYAVLRRADFFDRILAGTRGSKHPPNIPP